MSSSPLRLRQMAPAQPGIAWPRQQRLACLQPLPCPSRSNQWHLASTCSVCMTPSLQRQQWWHPQHPRQQQRPLHPQRPRRPGIPLLKAPRPHLPLHQHLPQPQPGTRFCRALPPSRRHLPLCRHQHPALQPLMLRLLQLLPPAPGIPLAAALRAARRRRPRSQRLPAVQTSLTPLACSSSRRQTENRTRRPAAAAALQTLLLPTALQRRPLRLWRQLQLPRPHLPRAAWLVWLAAAAVVAWGPLPAARSPPCRMTTSWPCLIGRRTAAA